MRLDNILSIGLEDLDDESATEVKPEDTTVVAETVVIEPNECVEEIELVEAAEEAAEAEAAVVEAAEELCEVECAMDDQIEVITETEQVVASMESFKGTIVTKGDALALQHLIAIATKGRYDTQKVVGSLEAFGTDITTDEALNAGLEGIGDFLKAARSKLGEMRKVMVARWVSFFKEVGVGYDKVARRAEALTALAKVTTGESTSSSIQLPLDTAWRLVKDGKVSSNLSKDLTEMAKFIKLVYKDSSEGVDVQRGKFVKTVAELATADYDQAVKIAKELVAIELPKLDVAKLKVPMNSTSYDVYRSEEILGGVALFYNHPIVKDNAALPLIRRIDNKYNSMFDIDITAHELGKRQPKLDCALDTLKPAEIAKLGEDVLAILTDIKQYSRSYSTWFDENHDLDRVIKILASAGWDEDGGVTSTETTVEQGDVTVNVTVTGLNTALADLIEMYNDTYAYLAVGPIRELSSELIQILNRVLEVGERCVATYNDNALTA